MELNDLNEGPRNVSDAPRIIFVKEYIDESRKNAIECRSVSSTPNDERIIVSPCNLEDNASVNREGSVILPPAIRQGETEQIPSIIEKLIGVLKSYRLQLFGIVSLCILSFVSITLIPYHNVILHPLYWYESIFIQVLGIIPSSLGVIIIQIKLFLSNHELTRLSALVKVTLLWACLCATGHCLVHLLWSFCFGYNSPIPYSLAINIFFTIVSSNIVMWNFLPQSLKICSAFRDRLKSYILYDLWVLAVPVVIPIIVETVNEFCTVTGYNMHWAIAVLLFLFKIKSDSIMEKYISKIALPENINLAKGLVTIENGVIFKSSILVLIGSKTDALTGHLFIAISVLFNMKCCYKVINLNKRQITSANGIGMSRNRIKEVTTTLMLNETLEFCTTIAYVLATSFAYYGPNAGLIGNIKNNYWQFHIIDSFASFLAKISYAVFVDISCGVITLIVLWAACNINGLLFFKDKIGQFAHIFAFCISREINSVSIKCKYYLIYILKMIKLIMGINMTYFKSIFSISYKIWYILQWI